VKEFFKKEIGMKYPILILRTKLDKCIEHSRLNRKANSNQAAIFWSKRSDQIIEAISILEKAENNTGS
jgi:hypothetical protein